MINNSIKSGAILGVINVIIGLLIYIFNPSLYGSLLTGILLIFLNIAMVIYFGIAFRKSLEEPYLKFSKAFQYSFVAFVISGLIGLVFRVLLFQVIDPGVIEVIVDATVENSIEIMKFFGAPDEVIDDAIEKAREDTLSQYSTWGQIKGFLWSLIFVVIGSLITAAIIKKSKPELS